MMIRKMKESRQKTVSSKDVARFLGVSHVAVYKRIKRGTIPAIRVGRNYRVPESFISSIKGSEVNASGKQVIDAAVKRTVREYGETLRLLGAE